MNKVRKQFILYAMLAIFILLAVLLTVINGVNFTMAGEDADQITQMLSGNRGSFAPMGDPGTQQEDFGRFGPMGPSAPDMAASVRYFTYAFDDSGNAKQVAFSISAVSEQEAADWAGSLLNRQGTGWSRGTYRYRVYVSEGRTFVTVIDQGRELLPSYRILIISLIGLVLGLAVSFAALTLISRRLFKPLEEADRKQKRFIADVEKEFKVPLTIINANTEVIERRDGGSPQIQSINRQVRKMTALVKDLGSLSVFDEKDLPLSPVDVSALTNAAADMYREKFLRRDLTLETDVEPGVSVRGDAESLRRMTEELLDNALKFSRTRACLTVRRENDRVIITQTNDTELPKGGADQVFDRFIRLDNARELPGAGLGLSYVKDIVKAHNGRVSARVDDGVFTLRIYL